MIWANGDASSSKAEHRGCCCFYPFCDAFCIQKCSEFEDFEDKETLLQPPLSFVPLSTWSSVENNNTYLIDSLQGPICQFLEDGPMRRPPKKLRLMKAVWRQKRGFISITHWTHWAHWPIILLNAFSEIFWNITIQIFQKRIENLISNTEIFQ